MRQHSHCYQIEVYAIIPVQILKLLMWVPLWKNIIQNRYQQKYMYMESNFFTDITQRFDPGYFFHKIKHLLCIYKGLPIFICFQPTTCSLRKERPLLPLWITSESFQHQSQNGTSRYSLLAFQGLHLHTELELLRSLGEFHVRHKSQAFLVYLLYHL